jgi:hypothetical protein
MPLEVGENILYQEGVALRHLQWGISAAVVDAVDERSGSGEKIIEVSPDWIVNSLKVGHAAVVVNDQVGHVAGIATDAVEHGPSERGRPAFPCFNPLLPTCRYRRHNRFACR